MDASAERMIESMKRSSLGEATFAVPSRNVGSIGSELDTALAELESVYGVMAIVRAAERPGATK